jgi:FMN phosphatase YigB (HAD superfamily)
MDNVVTFFDVDNTLLDNDAIVRDLNDQLERQFGPTRRDRYWAIFEALRSELGYADYLGALQRYRGEAPNDTRLLLISGYLMDYPFSGRLYPGALGAIERAAALGPTVILSDGDVVFQPRKVQRSGLWEAVKGRVLIYIHKEKMLQEISELYPARRYVMVDDKLRILDAMKQQWGPRLKTIFPRQGHYALDPKVVASYPSAADVTLEHIGDLAATDLDDLAGLAAS